MEHTHVLNQSDEKIHTQYHEIMNWLGTNPTDIDALLNNDLPTVE